VEGNTRREEREKTTKKAILVRKKKWGPTGRGSLFQEMTTKRGYILWVGGEGSKITVLKKTLCGGGARGAGPE